MNTTGIRRWLLGSLAVLSLAALMLLGGCKCDADQPAADAEPPITEENAEQRAEDLIRELDAL